jgi:hypothetical protein
VIVVVAAVVCKKEEMEAGRVRRIKLGSQGLEVSAQGLGCMGMSAAFYGLPKPEEDMIALIHHAVHSGITFLDTSDVYGPFTNEILLGKVPCPSLLSFFFFFFFWLVFLFLVFISLAAGFEGRGEREGGIGN